MRPTLIAMIAALATLTAAPTAAAQTADTALTSGWEDDPWTTSIQLRGHFNRGGGLPNCPGAFFGMGRDVELQFTASNRYRFLIFSVGSTVDTTLAVETPAGEIFCDDDSGALGLNPMVHVQTPRSGRYRVWVGVYSDGPRLPDIPVGATALISISELYSQ
jgi:hypothetical protein